MFHAITMIVHAIFNPRRRCKCSALRSRGRPSKRQRSSVLEREGTDHGLDVWRIYCFSVFCDSQVLCRTPRHVFLDL
jgi:hypothetical protein